MSVPAWWPQVVAATGRRRLAAGMLLAHATPVVDGAVLRLEFERVDIAEAWRDSGAQAALDAALEHCGLAFLCGKTPGASAAPSVP